MKANYGWVRTALGRKGMTQRSLAKATGIGPSRISKLCTGTYQGMRADELAKIMAVLGYGDYSAEQEIAEQYRTLKAKHRELTRRVRDLPSQIDRLRGGKGSHDDGIEAAASLIEGLFPLAEPRFSEKRA